MPWNADLYLKFKAERFQPFADLSALIDVRPNLKVIDLGCGSGELTRKLAEKLPGCDVLGIDSSVEMIANAVADAAVGLRFQHCEIEALDSADLAGPWDLIFSHAALHWVPDHARLIPELVNRLRPGGQLAVQMPSNRGHLTHRAVDELLGREPFRSAMAGWTRESNVLSLPEYAEMLHAQGCVEINAFEKIYSHYLADVSELVAWMSGTSLIPVFERLPDSLHDEFRRQYQERLQQEHLQPPVYFPFNRVLFAARRL